MEVSMKNVRITIGVSVFILGFFLCAVTQTAQAGPIIKISDDSWLMINYEMQLYGQWRNTGSGPDRSGDTTDIFFRRNRFSLIGQVTDTYGFTLAVQQQADKRIQDLEVSDIPGKDFDVIDAFFRGDFTDAFRVRVGLTKDPLIREDNEGCFFPLSVDRSLFIYTDLPRLNRDFGVVIWGNLMDAKLQYRAAVMKGNQDGDNPKSQLRYTGRVHLTLLDPESSLVYRGTYLGKKKVLTFGAGYQFQPDEVYANLAAKTLPNDYQAWTFDGFFEYPTTAGTFTVSAAYLKTDYDGAYKGADPDPRSIGENGEKKGWYAKAGYLLPNKVGPGEMQFFGRYEEWKFAQLSGIFDQKIKWWAGGVNYFIKGEDLRVTVQYSKTDYDKQDPTNPNTQNFDTVTAMFQFLF
jgi:Phosphate-selective porin O and P